MYIQILQLFAIIKPLKTITTEVYKANLLRVFVLNFSQYIHVVLLIFFRDFNINKINIKLLQYSVFAVSSIKRSLILFRNLIVNKILVFACSKSNNALITSLIYCKLYSQYYIIQRTIRLRKQSLVILILLLFLFVLVIITIIYQMRSYILSSKSCSYSIIFRGNIKSKYKILRNYY